jgi:hypothetical protein
LRQLDQHLQDSGIEKASKTAGAKVVPGNTEIITKIEILRREVKKAKVHELVMENDVFISVPILKDHNSTRMTACLKNMMGVVWTGIGIPMILPVHCRLCIVRKETRSQYCGLLQCDVKHGRRVFQKRMLSR